MLRERAPSCAVGDDQSPRLWALNVASPSIDHSLALANAGLALSRDAIIVVDELGGVVGANEAALALSGYEWHSFSELSESVLFAPPLAQAGDSDEPIRELVTAHGRRIPVFVREAAVADGGGAVQRLLALRDASGGEVLAERVRFMSQQDQLTGLPTRASLGRHFTSEQALTAAGGRRLALLFIDIDRFKRINDVFGRSSGDAFLRHAASAISHAIRETDGVSRIGGDEFVAMVGGLESVAEVSEIIGRIKAAFDSPFMILGEPVQCTVSIGVSLCPDDGAEFDDLVRKADRAMHLARRGGANMVLFHTEEMNRDVEQRRQTERALRAALGAGQIFVRYQPQVDLATGRIVGVEALARWERPGVGEVLPGDFIPVAEESGLIHDLGSEVVRLVCEQARRWDDMGIAVPVAVNVSPVEIAGGDVDARILEIVEETGLRPDLLTVEITESSLIDDTNTSRRILANLRESGIGVSIDDFLTGYSSFTYIRQFDATALKIDRSFVSGIDTGSGNDAIVRAAIQMAEALGVETVAEGVETEAEAEFLLSVGCAIAQGYWFDRPLKVEEIEQLLVNGYCGNYPATIN